MSTTSEAKYILCLENIWIYSDEEHFRLMKNDLICFNGKTWITLHLNSTNILWITSHLNLTNFNGKWMTCSEEHLMHNTSWISCDEWHLILSNTSVIPEYLILSNTSVSNTSWISCDEWHLINNLSCHATFTRILPWLTSHFVLMENG